MDASSLLALPSPCMLLAPMKEVLGQGTAFVEDVLKG